MMIWIIPAAAAVLVLLWGISVYNRLATERLKVRTQWSQIEVVLKQRFDLIPNLVETVKSYAAYEKEALQAVLEARAGYLTAAGPAGQMNASEALTGSLGRLMAVAESYPELKANGNFLHLQQEVSSLEQKLADYRQFYNDTVLRYNSQLVTVPSNLIAGLFGFREEPCLQISQQDQGPVTIEF